MKTSFKRFMSLVLVIMTVIGCCAPVLAADDDHVHTYDPESEAVLKKEATCSELGYTMFNCLTCGQAYIPDDQWVKADPSKHNLVWETDADCVTPGDKWQNCTICNKNPDGENVKEFGEKISVEPTGAHVYVFPAGFDCAVGGTASCSVCEKDNLTVEAKKCEEGCGAGVVCKHAHNAVVELDGGVHGKYNKCEACGVTEEVLHEFVTEVKKAPTCADGVMTFACVCGQSYEIKINKILAGGKNVNNHLEGALTEADTEAATCTTDGWNNRIDCEECGETYVSGSKVNKFNHTVTNAGDAYEKNNDLSVVADCETDGYDWVVCKLCQDGKKVNEVAKYGHYEVIKDENWDTKPDAAHKTAGKATVTCGRVGCDYSVEMTLPYSAYKMNNNEYVVSDSKYFVAADAINSLPTLASVANRPRYQYVENVYNTLNRYDFYQVYYHGGSVVYDDTIDPTCTTYGQYTEMCTGCGWQGRTGAVDPLGHDFGTKLTTDSNYEPATLPTCSKNGYAAHWTCIRDVDGDAGNEVCGAKSEEATVTNKLGHNYGEVANRNAENYLAPVCGTPGWELCLNENCNYLPEGKTSENDIVSTPDNKVPIPAYKHEYGAAPVIGTPANCVDVAIYVWRCTREGCVEANRKDTRNDVEYYSENAKNYEGVPAGVGTTLDPTNHKDVSWVTTTPATCLKDGIQQGTCLACGKNWENDNNLKDQVLPKEDHDHTQANLTGSEKTPNVVIDSKDINSTDYEDAYVEGKLDFELLFVKYGVVEVKYPAICGPNDTGTTAYSMKICSKHVDANEGKHHWVKYEDTSIQPDHVYQAVAGEKGQYKAPTCTTAGWEIKEVCIRCNETNPAQGKDGATIPSFHSYVTGLTEIHNGSELTGKLAEYFTYTAQVDAKCNASHTLTGGVYAYFKCKDAQCGAIYKWNGTSAYVATNEEGLKIPDVNPSIDMVADNCEVHCPTLGCTLPKCNVTADQLCAGNGWSGMSVCNVCQKEVTAGAVVENTNGATLTLSNTDAAVGGKGHLDYVKIEYLDSTCYSKGNQVGWKCTCDVNGDGEKPEEGEYEVVGGESIPMKAHTDITVIITYINADEASDTNKVYAQKEDACKGYEYSYKVCTMCKAASEQLTTPDGFTYTEMTKAHNIGANVITWTNASVPHVNADDNELYVGWLCSDDEFKALLNPENSLYDEENETFTKEALVCKECGKGKAEDGKILEGEQNPFKVGHTSDEASEIVQAPTCQVNGYTATVCADCGIKYVIDIVEASDEFHVWENVEMPATVTNGSYTVSTCTVCGEVKTSEVADDKLIGFNVKIEVVGDAFVKSGTLEVKIIIVNVTDEALAIQAASASFVVSDNLIYRGVKFTPVEGFEESFAKVNASIKTNTDEQTQSVWKTAEFLMNTFKDADGNNHEMVIPAKAEVSIATLEFIISDEDRTTLDAKDNDDTFTLGLPTVVLTQKINKEEEIKPVEYGVAVVEDAEEITKTITLLGDVNNDGTVNLTDSQVLAGLLENTEGFEGEYNKALDINKDGKITIADLAHIQRYITGYYEPMEFYNIGLNDNEIWAEPVVI